MAKKSYVVGVLDRLEKLSYMISDVIPEELAEQFLADTLYVEPQPPWQTGMLRRSGAVYIGQRKYMTTVELATRDGRQDVIGPNPAFLNPESMKYEFLDIGSGSLDESSSYSTPARLKLAHIKYKGRFGVGSLTTMRNKVSVMYQAPHAGTMHEWTGHFSDPYSGAYYVSAKALAALSKAAIRIQGVSLRHIR
jgi:hypothetical protein